MYVYLAGKINCEKEKNRAPYAPKNQNMNNESGKKRNSQNEIIA